MLHSFDRIASNGAYVTDWFYGRIEFDFDLIETKRFYPIGQYELNGYLIKLIKYKFIDFGWT